MTAYDCDASRAVEIWNRIPHNIPTILVTIATEQDRRFGNIEYREVPAFGEAAIRAILRSYNVHRDHESRWAEFCGGSPRVAHVIGTNLTFHPEDLLRPPDHSDVWPRFLSAEESRDSQAAAVRLRVAKHIALFKRFGFGQPVQHEARRVQELVAAADPSITPSRFNEVVRELRDMRVLQGETTLYLTPKALHVWLWAEWWRDQGDSFDVASFMATLSPQLREWYVDMFRYAQASGLARDVVKRLLGPDGPFANGAFLDTEEGSRFFGVLTEASPDDALRCLERTIGTWNVERLREFRTGRRQIVWALEKVAVWRDLFPGAARILLALAEAENEEYGNNSTGVFRALFFPGPSGTEASPEDRHAFLAAAFEHESPSRRLILIEACSSVFGGNLLRVLGAEYQGLRAPVLWAPKHPREIRDALETIFRLLQARMSRPDAPLNERIAIARTFLSNARRLTRLDGVAKELIDGVAYSVSDRLIDALVALEQVLEILHYDGDELSESCREGWTTLRDTLTSDDFDYRLRRFSGTRFFIDTVTEDGKLLDRKIEPIERLASEAIARPELLKQHLTWLCSPAAEDAGRFGEELGRKDRSGIFWPDLLTASRSSVTPPPIVLAGYIRGAGLSDEHTSLLRLDELMTDEATKKWVIDIAWRLGALTPARFERVMTVLDQCAVSSRELASFAVGGTISSLSPSEIERLI